MAGPVCGWEQASRKREDAIATEVRAYTERLQSVLVLGGVLVDHDYYGKTAIVERTQDIQRKWEWTTDRLRTRGVSLARALALKKVRLSAWLWVCRWVWRYVGVWQWMCTVVWECLCTVCDIGVAGSIRVWVWMWVWMELCNSVCVRYLIRV